MESYGFMLPPAPRKQCKFALQLDATLLMGAERCRLTGHLLELSEGGAFITTGTDASIAAGAGVFVHFVYQRQKVCEATGHVARVLPFGAERGLAIEFGFANSELSQLLHTLGSTPPALLPDLLGDISDIQIRLP
jgi:hypothetical protein